MSVSRAVFILVLAGTVTPALADQITCHSTGDRPEPCGTVQPGSAVTLARQIGNAPCIEGRTWGTGPDRDSIWVSSGCSAVFDVQPPGNGYANTEPMNPDGAAAPGGNSREWQRGYADAQRGSADPNATSQDYLEGFRAGEDAAPGGRDGAQAQPPSRPSDNSGVFEPVPNPPGNSDPRDMPRDQSDDRNSPDAYARNGAPRPDDRYPPPDDRYPPGDNGNPPPPGYRNAPPPPDAYGRRPDERYASIDHARSVARHACVDAAAQGNRFGPDRIVTRDVRWIGHGQFAVNLDTPDGPLLCTVDRDGNVQSIDNR